MKKCILSVIILLLFMSGCRATGDAVNDTEENASLASLASEENASSEALKTEEKELVLVYASWSHNYGSIESITGESDLIALIEVTGIANAYNLKAGTPMTEFNARVITAIYGTDEGDILSILQTGGESETRIVEIEDDPLMQQGAKYLIFAEKNSDGTCTIVGGPQGRLLYENNKFNSINKVMPRLRDADVVTVSLNITDMDADTLYAEIEKYLPE